MVIARRRQQTSSPSVAEYSDFLSRNRLKQYRFSQDTWNFKATML